MIQVDPEWLTTARRMISFFGFPLLQVMDMAITHDDYPDRCWYCHFEDSGLRICSDIKLSGVFLPYCVFYFVYLLDLSFLVEDLVYDGDLDLTCFL